MNYTQMRYLTIDRQASEDGVRLLDNADSFRRDGRPESWARDVERKALRKFEHSFSLRHLFEVGAVPRPDFLPPSAYSNR